MQKCCEHFSVTAVLKVRRHPRNSSLILPREGKGDSFAFPVLLNMCKWLIKYIERLVVRKALLSISFGSGKAEECEPSFFLLPRKFSLINSLSKCSVNSSWWHYLLTKAQCSLS